MNFLSRKNKGFTLIELLIVIAIIGMLSAIVLSALNTARAKARDARRAEDMEQIYTALNEYYNQYGCLPTTTGSTCGPATGTYSQSDSGSWDYSSENGVGVLSPVFMTFLQTSGFIASVPVDPLNNMITDSGNCGSGTYSYRYYCYPPGTPNHPGLHLGYCTESGSHTGTETMVNAQNSSDGLTDTTFTCK